MLKLNADGNNSSHIFLQATGVSHWILCQTIRSPVFSAPTIALALMSEKPMTAW
jgi:hypothetical protein